MIQLQKNIEIIIPFSGSDINAVIRIPSALEAEDILLAKYDNIGLFSSFVSSCSCPDITGSGGISAAEMLEYPGSRAVVLKVAEHLMEIASDSEYYNYSF